MLSLSKSFTLEFYSGGIITLAITYLLNFSYTYLPTAKLNRLKTEKHILIKIFPWRLATDSETLTPVNLNLINDLWVPNVFIYNLKTFQVDTQTLT